MGYRLNRLDEPVLIAVSKPLLTEFCIHYRLESCALIYVRPDSFIVARLCEQLSVIWGLEPNSSSYILFHSYFGGNLYMYFPKKLSFLVQKGQKSNQGLFFLTAN